MNKTAGILICTCILVFGAFGFTVADDQSLPGRTQHNWHDNGGNVVFFQDSGEQVYSQDTYYRESELASPYKGDGTQKWAFQTGSTVFSSPAIGSDGTIYVGSDDKKVYAINPNGTQKWVFEAGDWVSSSPAIGSDGTIYVGSNDNKLYAVNSTGLQKWVFQAGDCIESSPAIGSDGTVYAGSRDNKLYAINANGTQKWAFETGGRVNSSPAVALDGTIYVGSRDKKLYAVNPDGTQKWVFQTGDWIDSSPAIGSDGTIYVGSNDKKLYAINANGTQKWAFPTGSWVGSSPAIGSDGTIYVGSNDKKVYAINANGTQKWAFPTGDWVKSSPAIGSDGTIYVGSDDKKVYAINANGTQKWAFPTGGYVQSSPVIGPDGTLYVGSYDHRLNAIESSSSGLANSSWPMFKSDLKHTGRFVMQTVETPTFNPDGGSYPGTSINVTVVCDTPGATIRYTTNGSEPTESSSAVTSGGKVSVPVPGTLKARAWKTGMDASGTKTANYTAAGKVATPAFNPDGGVYSGSSVNVTVSCTTAGATIRYTTNGSEPTESSSAVTSGGKVSVPVPGTLKARAWKTGMNPSDTKTANYTASPVLSVSPGSREVSWDAESTNFSVSNTGGGTMNWTASVTDGAGWLSIQSGSSGTNSGTINLSFSQNTGASPRTGTITVTALGASGSPKAVTVRQNGNNSSDGYLVTSELWIKAVFKPTWMPHFDLRWQKCGDDVSATGDRTVWGYMYADPVDFPYGNVTNPEIFIKIYKAANGWQNIAFNHVTVDDVDVFSALNYTGIPNQSDTLTLYNRLVDHTYYLAEMKSAMYLDGDKFCEKDIPSIIRGSHLTGTLSLKEVLTAYMNRAGSGHMTHAGISEYLDAILDSNEVKEMIEWFYAVLLGKRPDALEVETWKNYLRSGLSLNVDARYVVLEMGRMFFESREYREGSRPDTRCIEDAFMVFLKRMPQGMEMSQLLSQLWLCEELMTMFARSTEFADRLYGIFMGSCGTPAGNLVAGIYSGLLNRLVYSDEMHRLSGLLEETGITKEAIAGIIIEILDTVEFTSGSPEHSDLIVRLYSTIHGHFPDSEKVFELAGQLESGIITPAVLVMSLIGSEDSLSASTGGAQGQP